MRIFNWVHRRFIPKDEQKLRKDDDDKHKEGIQLMNAGEEGALLFDKNSNDGDYHAILSIGTFGQHDDHRSSSFESWDDDEDGIVEAVDDECNDDHPLLYASSSSPDPAATKTVVAHVEEEEDDGDEISMMRKKERTTLAELFSAESKVDRPKATGTSSASAPKHEGSLFVKKKPSSKQESRPIHKLHGLMKRMLKRKIHPAADFSDPSQLHPFPFNNNNNKSLSHHHPADPDAASHEHQEVWT